MAGYVPSTEETAVSLAQLNPHAQKSAPVRSSAAVSVEPFGPVLRAGVWAFNRGLRFTTPSAGADSDLLAVASGALTFIPAAGGAPAVLALQLSGLDDAALLASGMPSWAPRPRELRYIDVDPQRVRTAIALLLGSSARRLAAVNKTYTRTTPGAGAANAAALAAAFVQQPETLPDGVPVEVGEAIGAAAISGLNRAFELQLTDPGMTTVPVTRNPAWYFAFWQMAGLIDLTAHALGGVLQRADQALEATGVMRFVAKTGADANAPFTDSGTPALTVRAAFASAADGDTIVILDTGTYAEAELVVNKAVNITSVSSLDAGQLHLGGDVGAANAPNIPALPVLQGNGAFAGIREDMANDTAFRPVAATHRVLRYQIPAGRGSASLTKVIIRQGGARQGGGIYLVESGPVVIASCHLHRNVAYFDALFFDHPLTPPDPYPGAGWSQEGFGGAICAFTSSPLIWGNRIDRNLALNGGGIGLFARCFPLIANNYIGKNVLPDWFGTSTPGDGGGIRVLSLNLALQTPARTEMSVPQLVPDFLSHFGTTIEVSEMYEADHVKQCQQQWIFLRGNRIVSNRAGDDGGGFYATGVSHVFSIRNNYTGNTAARGDGGGIRISTASVMRSISDNVANNRVTGAATEGATGGGIAARCSDLYLNQARIEGNTSHFAGAGISFTANREGAVTGVDWSVAGIRVSLPTWDEQRRPVFGYDHARLLVDGATRVLANTADDSAKGKGGGLYVFRQLGGAVDPSFVGDQVTVEIEQIDTVLDPTNQSGFVPTAGANTVHRLYLLDQVMTTSTGPTIVDDTALAAAPPIFSHISVP